MQQADLTPLIDGYLDETLSPEQAEQLFELLKSRHDAKMEFFKRLDLHAAMISDPAAIEMSHLQVLSTPSSDRKTGSHRRIFRMSIGILLSTTLLACVMIGGAWIYNSYFAPQATYVEATNGVQFSGTTESQLARSGLKRGEWIDVKTGYVVLRFRSGADVTLQGPARFQVVHADKGFLERGKLTAYVPEEAKGFVVQTDAMELVDWGTEFLVEAVPEKESTAVVRSGRCGGRPVINGRPQGAYQEITAGNALTFQFSRTAYDGGKPPRDWIPAQQAEAFGEFDQAISGVTETSGAIRYVTQLPGGGDPLQATPEPVISVVKEGGPVKVTQPLTFGTSEGYVHLSPGTKIQSFILDLGIVSDGDQREQSGEVTFEGRILGVINNEQNLLSSDRYFADRRFLYHDIVCRGIDLKNQENTIQIDESRHHLSIRLDHLDGWFDQVRVLTEKGD